MALMCMDCGERGLSPEAWKAHHCPPGRCHVMGCNDPRHVPAAQPETGDEALVREIAGRWIKDWSGSEGRDRMPGPDAITRAVREALRVGRAAENESCEKELRELAENADDVIHAVLRMAADAIAKRRGRVE